METLAAESGDVVGEGSERGARRRLRRRSGAERGREAVAAEREEGSRVWVGVRGWMASDLEEVGVVLV